MRAPRKPGSSGVSTTIGCGIRRHRSGGQVASWLRGEILTFLIAGHETTSTALTWTWFLLATHADVCRRVHEEIDAVVGDRPPTVADVAQLSVTRMVIEESMRLYPPVWATSREAVDEDEIAGYRIPARSMVILCPFVTHRHPEFWKQPEEFDPLRFSAEQASERPRGAYFPFLMGPHQCIGNEFAMLEMSLIVAMVLQKFELHLQPEQSIQPRASLTLRPNAPVWITLEPKDRESVYRSGTQKAERSGKQKAER